MITIAEEIGASDFLSSQDLKTLAGATPPCISLSVPFQQKSRTHRRLQKAVNELEAHLNQTGLDGAGIRNLLDPLARLANTVEKEQGDTRGAGLVVFRSPERFFYSWVRGQYGEWTIVADHFHIRALLPFIAARKPFYILALSQKNIRMLRCNGETCVDAVLPNSIPTSLEEALQTSKPDHVLDNRSTGGPSTGSMRGVMFGTDTDRERKDEYLLQFYKQVDRGLSTMLRDRRAPVVLAGVDYEIALYQSLSTYPDLVGDSIQGAPDSLHDLELHRRALAILRKQSSPTLQKALAQFRKQGGPPRAYQSPREIVKAAAEGRVAFLFLIEGAEYRGEFSEIAGRPRPHRLLKEEDLLNSTAMETLRHGGEVFVIPSDQLSEVSTMGAVLRY